MHSSGREYDNSVVQINVNVVERPFKPSKTAHIRMSHAREVAFACMLNVTSSVTVIFANKFLFGGRMGFHFGTALTIFHFLVCAVFSALLCKFGFFEAKRLSILRVLPISLAFSGYVAFNNLSLLFNTVCVYQLAKIVCTPTIVIIEKVYYGKEKSREVITSLFPTCIGVAIAVYSDPQINVIGLLWAVLAIVANSLYTIWGQTEQKALGVEAIQLLLYQAPISAVLLCFLLPFFDDPVQLMQYQWNAERIIMVLITCILAFGVNFSFFLGVGKTSPLTMNLLGHLKTILVFAGGIILFGESLTLQKLGGCLLTLAGLVMYGNAKVAEAQRKKSSVV